MRAIRRARIRDGFGPLAGALDRPGILIARLPAAQREIVQRCDLDGEAGMDVACDMGFSSRQFYRLRRAAYSALAAALAARTDDERAIGILPCARLDTATKLRLARLMLRSPEGSDNFSKSVIACSARAGRLRGLVPRAMADLPLRQREIVATDLARLPAPDLVRRFGVGLRQAHRLRRGALIAFAEALLARLERSDSTTSSVSDVIVESVREAMALHQIGSPSDGATILREAFRACDGARKSASLVLALVELECATARFDAARSILDAFRESSRGESLVERYELSIGEALLRVRSGDRSGSAELRDAVAKLALCPDDASRHDRASALAWGYLLLGDSCKFEQYRDLEASARDALRICDLYGEVEPMLEARALRAAGIALVFQRGAVSDGLQTLLRSYDFSVERNLRRERTLASYTLGGACLLIGDNRRAIDYLCELVRPSLHLSDVELYPILVDYAVALARSGENARARTVLKSVERLRLTTAATVELKLARAEIELDGNPLQALQLASDAAIAESNGPKGILATARCVAAEASFALGRRDRAKSLCFDVLELFGSASNSMTLTRALALGARLTGSADLRRQVEATHLEYAGASFASE